MGLSMKYIRDSQVRKLTLRLACLATSALAVNVPGHIPPVAYALSLVVKTGDAIDGKTLTGFSLPSLGANAPAINASGTVAFYATYSQAGFVGEGIFTPTSLLLKTGDVVGGQTLEGISFVPALNDNGIVAVRGLFSESSAILTSKKVLVKSGDIIGGQKLTSFGLPAINGKGTMAFVGSSSTGSSGVFTQTALLASSGETIAGQVPIAFGPPAINDRGTVAFQSWFSGSISTAILAPPNVLVKVGDAIGGKILTDLLYASTLNSDGAIAFVGVFLGGTGVFTQRDLVVRSGDTISGQTLISFGYPVISDQGVVAFFATTQTGAGIFTQTTLIAKTGDKICGRTVIGVGQPAISRDGAVAFTAQFSDRSSAIVLALPTTSTAMNQPRVSPWLPAPQTNVIRDRRS
jgi:hypothetical protein